MMKYEGISLVNGVTTVLPIADLYGVVQVKRFVFTRTSPGKTWLDLVWNFIPLRRSLL